MFLFNLVWSLRSGERRRPNPWRATTLEWQTPDTPPKHGNWGPELPVVYRWAYDYSVPGAPEDFIPQNVPPSDPRAGTRRRPRPRSASLSLTVAFAALATGIVVWCRWSSKLTAKPWEAQRGVRDDVEATALVAPARVGLWVFLAVVTSLFGLFLSAYSMRMAASRHGPGETGRS